MEKPNLDREGGVPANGMKRHKASDQNSFLDNCFPKNRMDKDVASAKRM